jgi:L-asparaginase
MNTRSKTTVMVLGTGGTIAGRASSASDNMGYKAGEVPVSELLGDVLMPAGVQVQAQQVAQIDSKDMGPAVWRPLLAAVRDALSKPSVCGVVVTHGTDTLEETAYLLQRVLNPAKPVVLVSAMRPATATLRDGPQNLQDGLQLAALPGARGVVAMCMGQVHSGLDVRKVHNHNVAAFDSGDAGCVGELREGRWTQWRPWPQLPITPEGLMDKLMSSQPWPRVEWVTSHGGQDGFVVRALLGALQAAVAQGDMAAKLQGLVVAGTGNGTVHQDLEAALMEAQAAGVHVRRTTRVARGSVIDAGRNGFEVSRLPPAKARLALMLDLLQ